MPPTPADHVGARVDCFPTHAAFPKWPEGRHPHCHFRGLLGLHTRYGPPDRSAAPRRPLSRGSSPASYPAEPLVSFQINRQLSGWNSSSTGDSRLRGARPTCGHAVVLIEIPLMLGRACQSASARCPPETLARAAAAGPPLVSAMRRVAPTGSSALERNERDTLRETLLDLGDLPDLGGGAAPQQRIDRLGRS